MDPMDFSMEIDASSPPGSFIEADESFTASFDGPANPSPPSIPAEPAAPVSNNRPGFKYKYPEAAPTPPGEDDADWNKTYTAADSRYYNRNGKSAEKSRKYRQSGETYTLALQMMAEKKEKVKGGYGSKLVAAAKPKAPKKNPTIKQEQSHSSRDTTPWADRVPMSISEQIKSDGRARKAPSAAPSSKQGTPAPAPKMGSPPPPKVEKLPIKKKGIASVIKRPSKPKGPDRPPRPTHTNHSAPRASGPPASDSESNDGGEYCICRGPDDHRMMVNCEGGCDEWYHCECIKMNVEDAKELLDRYICMRCASAEKYTTWKRMCRYHNVGQWSNDPKSCRKAARVIDDTPSKYCSDEHRDLFFEFVRDRLARQDNAPSMGGRLNVHEIRDILEHVKDNAELQALGGKPGLPIPEGYDPNRPIGLDYITVEEEAELSRIEAKKKIIQDRIDGYKLQQKLLVMAHERFQAAAAHPDCEEKGLCGYDNRLAFNETEFAQWMTTNEGKTAFETGKLGPRTDETKNLSTRQYSLGQDVPPNPDLAAPFDNMCQIKVKSCSRHRQWRLVHGQDYAAMTMHLKKDMEKLSAQANEIIEDAQTREASKDYDAHNVVEHLF